MFVFVVCLSVINEIKSLKSIENITFIYLFIYYTFSLFIFLQDTINIAEGKLNRVRVRVKKRK